MGLPNFPSPAEGVFPILLMNAVLSVALLKNLLRSVLQIMSANWNIRSYFRDDSANELGSSPVKRRISITQFKSLCDDRSSSTGITRADSVGGGGGRWSTVECCVCLCKFEAEEEVSELSCKHFFHRGCLEKWFDKYQHTTCPLCRSIR
ncbi:hypothetical protein Nepgr_022597 [Nepenthes gracilis]|uniref:RING-type domain-containing protein n=1 Tax=Nepenthes gracilis TaxID=150966 RepID=A0AAD3T117_NEPGR|nr:hypothetical protein Nepgr_022597 [Nepenthes gracilis]